MPQGLHNLIYLENSRSYIFSEIIGIYRVIVSDYVRLIMIHAMYSVFIHITV